MSVYIAVKHHKEDQSVYWFCAPVALAPYIKLHSRVTCDTRCGEQPGIVVAIMEYASSGEALAALRLPKTQYIRPILSAETALPLSWITIPRNMINGEPSKDKLRCRELEYELYKRFDTRVIFETYGDPAVILLKDGYTAYLTAKKLKHPCLAGYIRFAP